MSPEVPSVRKPAELPEGVSQATIGVRGGLLRSGFQETAEAMYLTSGYVYKTAADAEKAFTGEIDRYVYSRYGNPTISMFEERLRLIEGAPACFATATGMAAGPLACWLDAKSGGRRETFAIEQGQMMTPASPSLIIARPQRAGDALSAMWIGGSARAREVRRIRIQ